MKETFKDVNEEIYQKRVRKHLSQTQLANISGVSIVTISNIETRKITPTSAVLEKLRKALEDN